MVEHSIFNVPRHLRPTNFQAPAQKTFTRPVEYNVSLVYSHIDEYDSNHRPIEELSARVLEVKFLEVPGANRRAFFAFVPEEQAAAVHLEAGDCFIFSLIREVAGPLPQAQRVAGQTQLVGKVCMSARWVPMGYKALWMTFPHVHRPNQSKTALNIRPLSWTAHASPGFAEMVRTHPGEYGFLQMMGGASERKQIIAVNEELNRRNKPLEEVWKFLIMQRPSCLKPVDFYATVKSNPVDFERLTETMHRDQKTAFTKLRCMRAFAIALDGPPGSGKTWWAAKILIPLVQEQNQETKEPHLVLAMASTNEQADILALQIDKTLGGNIRCRIEGKPVIVVRMHSSQIEDDVLWKDVDDGRNRNLSGGQDNVHHLILAMMDLSVSVGKTEHEKKIAQTLLRNRNSAVLSASVHNDHPGLHLASHMRREMQATSTGPTHLDTWRQLRTCLLSYAAGVPLKEEDFSSLTEGIRRLRDAVLRKADVVVTTPCAVGQGFLRKLLKPSHIIIDGANHITEPSLWPTFAFYTFANNPNFKAMILLGDQHQLSPRVIASRQECHFRDQLCTSLFYRMVSNRLVLPKLLLQSRMHQEIADALKAICYGYKLQTHLLTGETSNKGARALRAFNQQYFNRTTNMMVLDVPQGDQDIDSSGSSYNEVNVQATVALLQKLLNHFKVSEECRTTFSASDICLLTFHSAQERLYQMALSELEESSPTLRAGEVRVATVEKFQGNQSAVVILDLTVVHKIGFLNEPGRINTALTRAKNALYVVGNITKTYRVLKESRTRYASLFALFERWHATGSVHPSKFVEAHTRPGVTRI